jgi:hypothetical protein
MPFSRGTLLGALVKLSIPILLGAALVVLLTQPVMRTAPASIQGTAERSRLRTHVETLAGKFAPRNYRHLDNLNQARAYIASEFASTGARVEQQVYEVNGHEYANVIARFGPDTAESVIVGAHYDGCGPYPAADDNASGVAGLLELARLLGLNRPAMRIELVAFTLEEPPYFATSDMGSIQHARALRKQAKKIRGMLSLEMLGYYSDAVDSQSYPVPGMSLLYPSTGNYITVAGRPSDISLLRKVKTAMASVSGVPVYSFTGPESVAGLSDNRSYWQNNYDAVMITDTAYFRNKHYHRASDLPGTLDYDRMAKVVDQVMAAVITVSK